MEENREPKPAPKPESTKHLRVLSNGAVYDTRKGRIVDARNCTTKITPQNSVELHSRRQELKRQALTRAANAVAAQGGSVDGHEMNGDWAWVEAVGEAMAMKSLTVNDPKAVDAARFLFQETGIAEAQQQAQVPGNSTAEQIIGAAVIEYIRRLHAEPDISASNNDADSRVIDVPPTDQEPGA
jgi:hypothetical protein